MRLTNRTDLESSFLRRLTAWVMRDLGVPRDSVKVTFKMAKDYRGYCWYGPEGIQIWVPRAKSRRERAVAWKKHKSSPNYHYSRGLVENLVFLLGHELCHRIDYYQKTVWAKSGHERELFADSHGQLALKDWRRLKDEISPEEDDPEDFDELR